MINLMVVWGLTGLWHGANWTFLFWGLYYGLLLLLEKFVIGDAIERIPGAVRHVYTMVLVLIGWVFFFSEDLGSAFQYLGVMFGIGAKGFIDSQGIYFLATNWLIYLVAVIGSTSIGFYLLDRIVYNYRNGEGRKEISCVIYLLIFLISVAFLVTENYNPFLYFRF